MALCLCISHLQYISIQLIHHCASYTYTYNLPIPISYTRTSDTQTPLRGPEQAHGGRGLLAPRGHGGPLY